MKEFGKSILSKFGWTEGEGLGTNGNGILKPITPKLKFDSKGVGFSKTDEHTFAWWDHAYNLAAQNLKKSESQNDDPSISPKSLFISTKKINRPTKSLLYGNFIKSKIMLNRKASSSDSSSTDSDDNFKDMSVKLTDEQLFQMCGGQTAHKGARHGLNMTGKLNRIKKQEEEMLLNQKKNPTILKESTPINRKIRRKSVHFSSEVKMKIFSYLSTNNDRDHCIKMSSHQLFSKESIRQKLGVDLVDAFNEMDNNCSTDESNEKSDYEIQFPALQPKRKKKKNILNKYYLTCNESPKEFMINQISEDLVNDDSLDTHPIQESSSTDKEIISRKISKKNRPQELDSSFEELTNTKITSTVIKKYKKCKKVICISDDELIEISSKGTKFQLSEGLENHVDSDQTRKKMVSNGLPDDQNTEVDNKIIVNSKKSSPKLKLMKNNKNVDIKECIKLMEVKADQSRLNNSEMDSTADSSSTLANDDEVDSQVVKKKRKKKKIQPAISEVETDCFDGKLMEVKSDQSRLNNSEMDSTADSSSTLANDDEVDSQVVKKKRKKKKIQPAISEVETDCFDGKLMEVKSDQSRLNNTQMDSTADSSSTLANDDEVDSQVVKKKRKKKKIQPAISEVETDCFDGKLMEVKSDQSRLNNTQMDSTADSSSTLANDDEVDSQVVKKKRKKKKIQPAISEVETDCFDGKLMEVKSDQSRLNNSEMDSTADSSSTLANDDEVDSQVVKKKRKKKKIQPAISEVETDCFDGKLMEVKSDQSRLNNSEMDSTADSSSTLANDDEVDSQVVKKKRKKKKIQPAISEVETDCFDGKLMEVKSDQSRLNNSEMDSTADSSSTLANDDEVDSQVVKKKRKKKKIQPAISEVETDCFDGKLMEVKSDQSRLNNTQMDSTADSSSTLANDDEVDSQVVKKKRKKKKIQPAISEVETDCFDGKLMEVKSDQSRLPNISEMDSITDSSSTPSNEEEVDCHVDKIKRKKKRKVEEYNNEEIIDQPLKKRKKELELLAYVPTAP